MTHAHIDYCLIFFICFLGPLAHGLFRDSWGLLGLLGQLAHEKAKKIYDFEVCLLNVSKIVSGHLLVHWA